MLEWKRKELRYLLDGIRARIGDQSLSTRVRERLAHIHDDAAPQARNIKASVAVLENVKTQLCSTCREAHLCQCNTLSGWSHGCPFLRQE